MTNAPRIEKEAADWVAALDRAGFDARDDVVGAFGEADKAFARWIHASFENRTAFLRAHAAWRRGDRLAALQQPDKRSVSSPSLSRWVALAAAACVAVVVLTFSVQLAQPAGSQVFETAVGGRETAPLADGSRLELNTDTRLTVRLSEDTRAVTLEKGEAYFDIAHDEARPFIVEAGDKRITVLGTKFTVLRNIDDVQVVVEEGRVKIEQVGQNDVIAPAVIKKGDVLAANAQGALIMKKTKEELDAALAWRRGLLIFDQMDLASVAEEFNRYNRQKIIVSDPDAAAIRIGGSFQAENAAAFVRLLEDGFGLTVERDAEKIVIKP